MQLTTYVPVADGQSFSLPTTPPYPGRAAVLSTPGAEASITLEGAAGSWTVDLLTSADGLNFTVSTQYTAAGAWVIPTTGVQAIALRVSAWSSGSILATLRHGAVAPISGGPTLVPHAPTHQWNSSDPLAGDVSFSSLRFPAGGLALDLSTGQTLIIRGSDHVSIYGPSAVLELTATGFLLTAWPPLTVGINGDVGISGNLTTRDLQAFRFFEYDRPTVALGDWVDVPYDPANFMPTPPWTVSAANQLRFSYTQLRHTISVQIYLQGTSLTTFPAASLGIGCGFGGAPLQYSSGLFAYHDSSGSGIGVWRQPNFNVARLELYRDAAGTPWPATTGLLDIFLATTYGVR